MSASSPPSPPRSGSSTTLVLRGITASRGAHVVLDRVDLTVAGGHRYGVVGPNGVGKSTLLAAAASAIPLDAGEARTTPSGATVGWLHQEPERAAESVRAALARRTGVTAAQAALDAATAGLAEGAANAADEYDQALHRWLALGAADLDARIGEVADELGFDERLLDQAMASLSGGEAARVGLAALLLSRYDVFLLDEPTNDLDLAGLAVLERWVLGLDAPVLLVSHDRRFLDRVVTDVVEIDEFTHQVREYGGGWRAYLDERERSRRHAWERFEEYDSSRRSLADRAQRQREWAQQGTSKARRSMGDEPDKNIRAFKIDQTEQLAGKAAQTKRAMERLERVDKPREPWQLRLEIPAVERSGDVVARLDEVVVDRAVVDRAVVDRAVVDRAVAGQPGFRLGPIDVLVGYGDRIALVGHNGSGKTTLIDVLVGRLAPTGGTATLGRSVVVGEIEQVREQLGADQPVLRVFTDATGWTVSDVRTLLAKFGLVGDHVDRPAASLSPGERTRASLALLMANGANLLVLDEPTNHLDLPAIEQLEQALETFPGTIVLVTHDRAFLDAVHLTRTWHLDHGHLTERTP